MLNLAALTAVRDYLHTHPDQHQQALFYQAADCGTSMCIAGAAAYLDGRTFVNDNGGRAQQVRITATERRHFQLSTVHNKLAPIATWARHHLGLDDDQADQLFYESNHRTALRYLDDIITAAEQQVPAHG